MNPNWDFWFENKPSGNPVGVLSKQCDQIERFFAGWAIVL
jgi:hypothetical protein